MAYKQPNNPFVKTQCGRRYAPLAVQIKAKFNSPFAKTYATDAAYVKQRDKGNRKYEKETGGKLVTNNPKGRKSYCARSKAQLKMWPKAAKDPKSGLRRARRKWGC
jgi:hypothetical protein